MGYIILFGWIVLLPICAGELWNTKKNTLSMPCKWLWGQFLLWAIFQIMAVHFILREEDIQKLVSAYVAAGLTAGALGILYRCFWGRNVEKHSIHRIVPWITEHKVLISVFVILFVVQMLMIVMLAVNDGDDAYYMAVASHAAESGRMYTADVYSFGYSELNYRYALAPLPIWIAFLSRISDVHTLTIGHVAVGMLMLSLSYIVYASIGKELFGLNIKKKLQFLIGIGLLYVWGNTSSHTPESFLLLRSRQGKALAAGLVFPAMIYLLIKIGHRLEQRQKLLWQDYLLATVIILAGSLGSTLGGALVVLLWASGLLFLAIGYKRISMLLMGAFSTLPGMIYIFLYLLN